MFQSLLFIGFMLAYGAAFAQPTSSILLRDAKFCLAAPIGTATKTNSQFLSVNGHELVITSIPGAKKLQVLTDNASRQPQAWAFDLPADMTSLTIAAPKLLALIGAPVTLIKSNERWEAGGPPGALLEEMPTSLDKAVSYLADDMKDALFSALKTRSYSRNELLACFIGLQDTIVNYRLNNALTDIDDHKLSDAILPCGKNNEKCTRE